ncbi:MAG TPA: hypothetical protein VLU25_04955 [Acidobacteriota bacterium]|nr:hypothetical protein [Acidobacteriota bacterium]
MRHFFVLLAAVALAAACGGPPHDEEADQSAGQSDPGQEDRRLEGTLAPTVEEGGWVLKTEEGDFLLLNLQDYPTQPWFREGALVKAAGQVDAGAVTIYMQGTPFRVESIEPAED